MIYYTVPFNSEKNIGEYYNAFAKLLSANDYMCFIDADTTFTTYDYGTLIENVIKRYPEVDAFTCCTNRVACKWQIAENVNQLTDDIVYHRNFGKYRQEKYGTDCVDVTNKDDKKLFSGLFLLIKKSAWDKIGGAISEGMLKVDNDIHRKLKKNGLLFYQMQGLYLYHWYRGGDRNYKDHLLKEVQTKKDEEKHTKVIYTCITGGYDTLDDPSFISDGFDYICFTDNPYQTSNVWKIKPIPKELKEFSNVRQQRCVKINPHKYLSEYELSIWVDGKVNVIGDLNKLIKYCKEPGCYIYCPLHPQRNCAYDELKACINLKKDDPDIMKHQLNEYKEEGFPKNFGLLQSNILVRYHNNENCIKFMEQWWAEVKNKSFRDQLSFNYVSWKNQDIEIAYLDKTIQNSEFFLWFKPHNEVTKVSLKPARSKWSPVRTSTKKPKCPTEKIEKQNNPVIVKIINKPTTVKTLETYKLPTKSIRK